MVDLTLDDELLKLLKGNNKMGRRSRYEMLIGGSDNAISKNISPDSILEYAIGKLHLPANISVENHKIIPVEESVSSVFFDYLEDTNTDGNVFAVDILHENMYDTYSSKYKKISSVDCNLLINHKADEKKYQSTLNKDNVSSFSYRITINDVIFYIVRIFGDSTATDSDRESYSTYIVAKNENFLYLKELLYNSIVRNFSGTLLDENLEPIDDSIDDFDSSKYIITDSLKQLFDDIEMFTTSKQFYVDNKLPYKRGSLLIGQPGNGKTMSLKYIAQTFKLPIIVISQFDVYDILATLISAFEGIKKLNEILNKPVLLFVEEINVVMEQNGGRELLLTYLDGVKKTGEYYFVGTTNKPNSIDPAILNRPSRIDNIINISHPDKAVCKKYLSQYFPTWSDDEIEFVSEKCKKFSFAFLKNFYIEYVLQHKSSVYNEAFVLETIKNQKKHFDTDSKEILKAVTPDIDGKKIGFD